jgi:hypothetical protein
MCQSPWYGKTQLNAETDTEKYEFCSIEVLDETADSKATVLKTLNILHKKFQIEQSKKYINFYESWTNPKYNELLI